MKRMILTAGIFMAWLCIHAQTGIITLDIMAEIERGAYCIPADRGCWEGTYDTQTNLLSFNDGMFNFSHIPGLFGGTDVGGGMSYWDGFTICNTGDNADHGASGNSDGWVANQWGCMAGGGLDEELRPAAGRPYLVGYWGYYFEEEGVHSCLVTFDGNPHTVLGTFVCNHPWPYYGNIHGDGFAFPLDYDGAKFTITAHGMLGGEDTGSTVELTLAEYVDDTVGLVQSAEWTWMDLTSLGLVDAVYFTMFTTDASLLYGANTAVYFCLDRMQICTDSHDEALPYRPGGLNVSQVGEHDMLLAWNPSERADTYYIYVNDSLFGTTPSAELMITGLCPFTEYTLKVVAGNDAGFSDPASIRARTIDVTPPTAPAGVSARCIDCHTIALEWDASTDNVAVARYRVYLNGIQESHPRTNSYTLIGLDADTEYLIEIDAQDESGNSSARTGIVVRTQAEPAAGIADAVSSPSVTVYDIGGRRAESLTGRGIYITGNKKVLFYKH